MFLFLKNQYKDLKCLCLGLLAHIGYLATVLVSFNSDGKSEVIVSFSIWERIC